MILQFDDISQHQLVAAADPPRTGRRGVWKRQGLVALAVIDLRPQPDAEFQYSLQLAKATIPVSNVSEPSKPK